MLSENIRNIRKAKGLSQEELAIKLNVVRQTVSKWEQGLSVPDSELLLALSEALETPVSTLLGETVSEPEAEDLKAISQKLEVINLQLSQQQLSRRKRTHWFFIAVTALTLLMLAVLFLLNSPYLGWDYSDPETAVLGTAAHSFEWIFVRIAPVILIVSIAGIIMTRRKDR
ncbi:MAG: helix-turn-helix transcriptional regulator [Erysipelotrichaceae bacterium]|nr:helix-turn-helix transcriptional regulator [Erysipelotrichaceae bacterium]